MAIATALILSLSFLAHAASAAVTDSYAPFCGSIPTAPSLGQHSLPHAPDYSQLHLWSPISPIITEMLSNRDSLITVGDMSWMLVVKRFLLTLGRTCHLITTN